MRLLDSNIFIYAAKPEFRKALSSLLLSPESCGSEMSILEALGYHKLPADEKEILDDTFFNMRLYPITRQVIDKAVEIRQQRRMSAGDAIHAATALLHGLELYTRNIGDFDWIPGLKVVNPIP